MPRPTKPVCSGSCPEPPPESTPTWSGAVVVGAHDEARLAVPAHERAVRALEPLERLVDDLPRVVDEVAPGARALGAVGHGAVLLLRASRTPIDGLSCRKRYMIGDAMTPNPHAADPTAIRGAITPLVTPVHGRWRARPRGHPAADRLAARARQPRHLGRRLDRRADVDDGRRADHRDARRGRARSTAAAPSCPAPAARSWTRRSS